MTRIAVESFPDSELVRLETTLRREGRTLEKRRRSLSLSNTFMVSLVGITGPVAVDPVQFAECFRTAAKRFGLALFQESDSPTFRALPNGGSPLGIGVIAGPGHYLVGRSAHCDLRICCPGVSRHHATLQVFEEGGCVLRDAGSTNGTWVNGRRIDSEVVVSLSMADFGPVRLMIDPCAAVT